MPPPEEAVSSYSAARACFEGLEVTTVPKNVRFGGESMTKQCFHNTDYPWWVCLVVTESKKRLLDAEVAQLLALGKVIPTPYLGPGTTVEELVFSCKRKGQQAYGFMQQMFGKGFIETKVQNDESGNWLYDGVLRGLASAGELENVKQFIALLEAWVAREDIPDLQVAFDPRTRALYVFDPGDPENWGSLQSKHLGVIRRWKGLAQHYKPRGGFSGGAAQSSGVVPVPSQPLIVVSGSVPVKQTGRLVAPSTGLITRGTTVPVKAEIAQLVSPQEPPPPSSSSVMSIPQKPSPSAVGPPELKCGVCGSSFGTSFQLSQHRFASKHL